MTTLWLLTGAVISSGWSGFLYKRVSEHTKNRAETALVSILWFLPLALIFGAAALFSGGIVCSPLLLMPALIAAIAASGCAFFFQQSMKQNSYSFSVIIINLSFIFPIILSLLFLNDRTTGWLQFAGILVAIAANVIVGSAGPKDQRTPWIAVLIALAASFGNGLLDFAVKLQQTLTPGEGEFSFFFFTYLFASLFSLLLWSGFALRGEKIRFQVSDASLTLPALGIGLCNGVCFFSISLLSSRMNAAAQFTIITSLGIVLSLALGWLRLKEKFTLRDGLSFLFCALAIACQALNL